MEDLGVAAYAKEEKLPIEPVTADEASQGGYAYVMRNMDMAQKGECLIAKPHENHLIACFKKKGAPVYTHEYVIPAALPDTGKVFEPIKIEVIPPKPVKKPIRKAKKKVAYKRKVKNAAQAEDIQGFV